MGLHRRVLQRRSVQGAIAIVIVGTTFAAVGWRRAVLERRLTREVVVARLQHAADAGRGAIVQEIARIHDTLREVVAAPPGDRRVMMAALAGDDAERTAILLDDQRVTLFPARVLRYVPDAPVGDVDELVARYERLLLLRRPARLAEAASILRDLESGTWTISRSTYEAYRDALEDFVTVDRDVPLWEEAVHAVRAASRTTADQSGEVVIWVDESHPVLLIWRSRGAAAIALAVTGRYVADRWLRAQPGFGYGIDRADRQAFLPYPPGDPHTERILTFAGHEWRMITFAWP